jgi:hypothetical protein
MTAPGHESPQTGIALQESSTGELRATVPPEMPFDREDLQQFDRDDVSAGRAIGKMLALFFLYTIVAMSLAAYWTWTTLSQ